MIVPIQAILLRTGYPSTYQQKAVRVLAKSSVMDLGANLTHTYRHAFEASVEIEIGAFAISGLYMKLAGTNLVGVGSCTGRACGSSVGSLYYNDEIDLKNARYKLYCIIDNNGSLRIDFVEITGNNAKHDMPPWKAEFPNHPDYEVPTLVYVGSAVAMRDNEGNAFVGVIVFEQLEC
ncbi:LAMI_0E12090g1_1 [Lachancea mirantina]|uniref:LAMI_0E12090g1_1 n=1 Tax=Lachancea mirantina TaxID=1230905 RepID=A0A1G4JPX8_9SACH|nr:LAMI_0E12090g1_1 [Lachancea mirantina]